MTTISTVHVERSLIDHITTGVDPLQVIKPGNSAAKPVQHEFIVPRIPSIGRPDDRGGVEFLTLEILCVLPVLAKPAKYLALSALVEQVRAVVDGKYDVAAAEILDTATPTPNRLGLLCFGPASEEREHRATIDIEGHEFTNVDVCKLTVECRILVP